MESYYVTLKDLYFEQRKLNTYNIILWSILIALFGSCIIIGIFTHNKSVIFSSVAPTALSIALLYQAIDARRETDRKIHLVGVLEQYQSLVNLLEEKNNTLWNMMVVFTGYMNTFQERYKTILSKKRVNKQDVKVLQAKLSECLKESQKIYDEYAQSNKEAE